MASVPTEPLDTNVDQLLPEDVTSPPETTQADDFNNDGLFASQPLIVEEQDPPPFGKSWAFDFIAGDFLPGPGGGPLSTHEKATLRFWIEKCLRTERGAYPIYDENYGFEGVNDVIGLQQDAPEIASLPDRIRDALTFHPRITNIVGVRTFQDPNDEALFVSFRVVVDEGDSLQFDNFAIV